MDFPQMQIEVNAITWNFHRQKLRSMQLMKLFEVQQVETLVGS